MKKIAIFLITLLYSASVSASETAWRNISEEIGADEINCVAPYTDSQYILFVGTDKGLFFTDSAGKNWKIKNIGWGAKNIINDIFICSGLIYMSTQGGLYVSEDGGGIWSRSHGVASRMAILSAVVLPGDTPEIYIATIEGLLRSLDRGRNWESVKAGRLNGEAIEDYVDDGAVESFAINCIAVSNRYAGRLYIGTDDGIYFKERDSGVFNRFMDEGLTEKKVRYIVESITKPYTLYAVTKNHIYYFTESWNQFDLPRYLGRPNSIALDAKDGNPAFLATDRGLFRFERPENIDDIGQLEIATIYNYFKDEPAIRDVQNIAIEYAEVHPRKIAGWRTRANISAIMPHLSFGIDRNSSDGLHWDAGQNPDTWVVGPENESSGWDITFTWDLSELIWNGAQTLIDVRSKLMVQLRDDILDEVTSYYYERRRLQIELLDVPSGETHSRIKKELRVQELTANLDALTGGYFSRQLGQR